MDARPDPQEKRTPPALVEGTTQFGPEEVVSLFVALIVRLSSGVFDRQPSEDRTAQSGPVRSLGHRSAPVSQNGARCNREVAPEDAPSRVLAAERVLRSIASVDVPARRPVPGIGYPDRCAAGAEQRERQSNRFVNWRRPRVPRSWGSCLRARTFRPAPIDEIEPALHTRRSWSEKDGVARGTGLVLEEMPNLAPARDLRLLHSRHEPDLRVLRAAQAQGVDASAQGLAESCCSSRMIRFGALSSDRPRQNWRHP